MKHTIFLIGIFIFVTCTALFAQTERSSWQRPEAESRILQLFHSPHAIVLPTAETLSQGDILFEVSHRFLPSIGNGIQAFWGVDGPANIRLALGYGVTDRFLVNLGRTNVYDNIDVQLKYKAMEWENKLAPTLLTIQAGAAVNTEINEPLENESKRWQYYGQLVFNTLIKDKFGMGLVPSYLDNSHIFCKKRQYAFAVGTYGQYYVSRFWSVLFEWTPTVTGWRQWHNSVSFGVELETGGHFFKLFFTNNGNINTSQYLAGADLDFNDPQNWRFGFLISRTL